MYFDFYFTKTDNSLPRLFVYLYLCIVQIIVYCSTQNACLLREGVSLLAAQLEDRYNKLEKETKSLVKDEIVFGSNLDKKDFGPADIYEALLDICEVKILC